MLWMTFMTVLFVVAILPIFVQANVVLFRGMVGEKGGVYLSLSLWMMNIYGLSAGFLDYLFFLCYGENVGELKLVYPVAGLVSIVAFSIGCGINFIDYTKEDRNMFGKLVRRKVGLEFMYLFDLAFIQKGSSLLVNQALRLTWQNVIGIFTLSQRIFISSGAMLIESIIAILLVVWINRIYGIYHEKPIYRYTTWKEINM